MAFRSDLEAAHARSEALEREIAELRAENAELKVEDAVPESDGSAAGKGFKRGITIGAIAIAMLGAGFASFFWFFGSPAAAIIIATMSAATIIGALALRSVVEFCPPGFAVVLSGVGRTGPDGRKVYYRVCFGGRVVRTPILESATLFDVRPRRVEGLVSGAFARDNLPVDINFLALWRFASSEPRIHNAIDRFLGRALTEADEVVKETLKGNIRGVVAELSEKQLRHEHEQFADLVLRVAREDMDRLGIKLESVSPSLSS